MGFIRNLFGKKESAHPNFFEEMKTIFQTTLLPLGFEEEEGMGWGNRTKHVHYSRGELLVSFWLDVLDSIYRLDTSSKTEVVNGEKRPVFDFSVECSSIKKADEFKSESIAKLNEWLVTQRVK